MIQCATVLSKIQPVTYKEWEVACWKDLHKRGWVCLTIDMDIALRNLISDGYVVKNTEGYCNLTNTLDIIIKNINIKIERIIKERNERNEKSRLAFRQEIEEIDSVLLKHIILDIIDKKKVHSEGHYNWEELESLLELE